MYISMIQSQVSATENSCLMWSLASRDSSSAAAMMDLGCTDDPSQEVVRIKPGGL